jgi:hypothetical protein
MKIEKLSLKSIKNGLNRDELKKIMAGSGGGTGGNGGGNCGNPTMVPPVMVACHDNTGFVIAHVYTNYCDANPCTLSLCQAATSEHVSYATGSC